MRLNIFNHEFGKFRSSLLIWSLAIVAMLFIFMAMFSSFADDAALLNDMMSNFPPELLAAFGMTGLNMATVLGFFSIIFLFVQICLAIQAANLGFGLVSIEESELTADFLLTKPVSRTHILSSKLLAALACMLATNAVVWASSYLAIELLRAGQTYDPATLNLVLISILPFQLFFFSVGLVISLLVKRVRNVTPYALGLGFGMYAISAFTDIGEVSILELLTPFKHFDVNGLIRTGSFDLPLVGLSLAVILVSLVASYWLYLRRDIHAVV